MKKNKILFLIFILVIVLVIAIIALNKQKQKNTAVVAEDAIPTPYYENSNIDKLANMSEKERIKFYFSQYIDNLENGNYEVAYDLLYDEFKENYFPTFASYKEYVEKKYPDIITVNYDNIQTEGYYYIFTMTFYDLLNDTSFTQKFVLREYNFNDVALSFQAD